MNFTDEINPYESPVVRAELVGEPRPTEKRQPLLAFVFTLIALPFMVGTLIGWVVVVYQVTHESARPDGMAPVVFGAVGWAVITGVAWLIPLVSAKELIQYLRGR